MSSSRARDAAGRPRNDRPRDGLGRPLSRDDAAAAVDRVPDDLVLPPAQSLAEAQRLLDAGRPFHAHEVLEGTWKAAPAGERDLWQGLAQLAVGLTHVARGNSRGAVTLLERAARRLTPYRGAPSHGVDVDGLVEWADGLATRLASAPAAASPPVPPRLVLPAAVPELVRRWGLVLGPRLPSAWHFLSVATTADGAPVVLKVAPTVAAQEAAFLRESDGRGAVRLLAEDAGTGAMLLERARPGDRLDTLVPHRDAEATAVLADVARRLHAVPAAGCALPPLAVLRRTFRRYADRHGTADAGPLPAGLVERARALFDDLVGEGAPAAVRLHGDLHHHNVLRAEREPWLAIDPHGWVGDPGYDAAAVLYNPWPDRRDDALLALVPARLEQLADGLGQPLDRLVAWGFVKAVISEVWTDEGGGVPGGRALDVARLLADRVP